MQSSTFAEVIVEERGQLLAQAFIGFGAVTAHDRAVEQPVLNVLRQLAPQVVAARPSTST
jgi:hypothetical protein